MSQVDNRESIVAEVKSKLFEAAMYVGDEVWKKAMEVVNDTLKCVECSLWTVNHNNTRGDDTDFVSVSVIYRKDNSKFEFSHKDRSFVHELKGTLFEAVVDYEEKLQPYYVFRKGKDPCFASHTTQEFVDYAKLQELVIIPICVDGNVSALLNLSYSEHKIDESVWSDLSKIISKFLQSAYNKYLLVQKHRLMNSLIGVHGDYKNEKVEVLFDNIRRIIEVFCPSQGVSFFMWDKHQYRYKLVATSGLNPQYTPKGLSYMKGEGITGWVAEQENPKPFITDDIRKETLGNHYGKIRELMKNEAQTAMYIPINGPSAGDGVVGVFRLINKRNVCNKDTIDYYNTIDAKLMQYASDYLALVINRYQREEEQTSFISKLAHEFKTPANSIYKTAGRLIEKIDKKDFLERYQYSYLENIVDFAQLQIWQAETTLFLARNGKYNYNNERCLLFKVLEKSRTVVKSMARDYGLRFSNIVIMSFERTLSLSIDKDAFVIVFHNLLSNAIKYCDPDNFFVSISCHVTSATIDIIVQDFGMGIDEEEKERIFQVGYRGTNVIRRNTSGFGVGLPVVRQIVEDYGGRIRLDHCKNPTRFIITLPSSLIYQTSSNNTDDYE